jgi:acyl-coenzyme A thioesterase PaaI-like protein
MKNDQSPRHAMDARPEHIAPNGYLQASVVVALADMTFAPFSKLPQGATGFTTIELKVNLLATARVGESVLCEAMRRSPAQGGF